MTEMFAGSEYPFPAPERGPPGQPERARTEVRRQGEAVDLSEIELGFEDDQTIPRAKTRKTVHFLSDPKRLSLCEVDKKDEACRRYYSEFQRAGS